MRDLKYRIISTGMAVLMTAMILAAVDLLAWPGTWIYEFFFHRSVIQFVTLLVFSLTLTLLFGRLIKFGRRRRRTVHAGVTSSRAAAEGLSEEISTAYEAFNFLISMMPALGLLGTVLGLSISLSTAFGGASVGPMALQQFVTALATALDTTVLGLICAMITGALAWLLNRAEHEDCKKRFSENGKGICLDMSKGAGEESILAEWNGDCFPAAGDTSIQLQWTAAQILNRTGISLEQFQRSAIEALRANLAGTVREHFREECAHQQELTKNLSSDLRGAVHDVGDLIERRAQKSARELDRNLCALNKTLRQRTPSEVIIHYNGNGAAEQERNDAHS